MKNMINIGNEITKNDVTLRAAGETITSILRAGAETHAEQATIQIAIQALSELAPVKNVNITNSVFTNGPEAAIAATDGDDGREDEEEEEIQ